jgi:hypothetical protein
MENRFIVSFSLLILGFSTFCFAAQTTVYVQAPQVSGGASEGEAVHDLIEASVGEMNDYRISTDQKEAKISLKIKVVKLGNALMVAVEKIEGGQVKFATQLKAAQPDELDIVCRRLAKAVMSEKAPSSEDNVHEVTKAETVSGTNRKDVVSRWIFGFGPTGLFNLNNSATAEFGGTIGYSWELAEPSVMLKLFYDGAGGFGSFGIGADYFFSQSSTSLFGGIDMGYGGAQVQGNPASTITTTSVNGFSAGADLGFAFFRTSRVNMELALRVATLFASNSYGLPGQYGLRLNILF